MGHVDEQRMVGDYGSPLSRGRHENYCATIPACLIMRLHSAVSSAKNLAVSARVVAPTSSDISFSLPLTSALLRISTTSRLIRSPSAAGVFGGATRPNQVIERNPGSPASVKVGISATALARSRSAIASTRPLFSR